MDGLTIAASLSEIRGALLGATIRTIHHPAPHLYVFRTSGAEPARVLVDISRAMIHLTDRRIPNPFSPSSFTMLLRKHLRGGRVIEIRQRQLDRVITFEVRRGEGHERRHLEVVVELLGVHGNLLLLDDGRVVAAARPDRRNRIGEPYVSVEEQPKHGPTTLGLDLAEAILGSPDPARELMRVVDGVGRATANDVIRRVRDAGTLCGVLAEIATKAQAPEPYWVPEERRAVFYPLPGSGEPASSFHQALDRQMAENGGDRTQQVSRRSERARLQREIGRHARAVEKLRAWLASADQAAVLQHEADLLMIHLRDVPRGARQTALTDPQSGESVMILLDASLSAIENAQRRYEKAKRLRRGRGRTEERLAHVEEMLESAKAEFAAFEASDAVPVLRREAPVMADPVEEERDAHVGIDDDRQRQVQHSGGPRRCQVEGFTILVGRNAGENDDLVRGAAPDDIWMHARGHAGSHVVVKRGGRRDIPDDVLRRAASLAAYYSKARGERRVEVITTEAKHVRKPRHAAPGLVIVAKESTLTVEPRAVDGEENP